MADTPYIQVITTIATIADAENLAKTLVEQKLAACVQIAGPIRSTYRWKGTTESAEEWMCILKSKLELYPELEQAIRAMHSYEVPEILAVPVVAGNPAYLAWMQESFR